MVNTGVNYFSTAVNSVLSAVETSSGSNGQQIASNSAMYSAGGQLASDLINATSSTTSSGMVAIYNDLSAYQGTLSANGATAQTISGVGNYVTDLLSLIGSSAMASPGLAAVNNIVSYTLSNRTQSNGVLLNADGNVDGAGASLKAAMSAFASSSGSSTNVVAVLNALGSMTTAMGKDGASSGTIQAIVATTEAALGYAPAASAIASAGAPPPPPPPPPAPPAPPAPSSNAASGMKSAIDAANTSIGNHGGIDDVGAKLEADENIFLASQTASNSDIVNADFQMYAMTGSRNSMATSQIASVSAAVMSGL